MARILYIEDDASKREAFVEALETRNHDVTAVGSVGEAQAAYRLGQYDIIITDYRLPDGTGLDFVRGIRQNQQTTPVLLLSDTPAEDIESKNPGYGRELNVQYLDKEATAKRPDYLNLQISNALRASHPKLYGGSGTTFISGRK